MQAVNLLEAAEATSLPGGVEGEAADGLALRVLVVDDHPAIRAGVCSLLEALPEVAAVTAVANARKAVAAARERMFDVAVVDYHLPDRDGLSLTRQLHNLAHPPRVLIFSAFADERLAIAALVAGADGICSKGCADVELWDAIRAVVSGVPVMPVIHPAAMRDIAGQIDSADLSILAMLISREEPQDIAAALGIRRGWLEARRWAILQQLTEAH
jgi:DNA-binding NarL/FixJ family response regulator